MEADLVVLGRAAAPMTDNAPHFAMVRQITAEADEIVNAGVRACLYGYLP